MKKTNKYQGELFKEKNLQNYKSDFVDFINKTEIFEVVRIMCFEDEIKKDFEKSKEFKNLEDAKKYFFLIKYDFVENCEVLTAIFKETEINKEYVYIKKCRKKKQTVEMKLFDD